MRRFRTTAAQSVAYGLNKVETLRQSDGLSGTLYNVPMIIGPSRFAVLISTETGSEVQSGGNDLGTNHITWGTLNHNVDRCARARPESVDHRRVRLRLVPL